MITTALLYIFYGFISVILLPLKLLPDYSLPSGISSAIGTASSYLSSFNAFFPIATLLSVFGIVVALEAGIFTYKLIKWVYTKIPGVN